MQTREPHLPRRPRVAGRRSPRKHTGSEHLSCPPPPQQRLVARPERRAVQLPCRRAFPHELRKALQSLQTEAKLWGRLPRALRAATGTTECSRPSHRMWHLFVPSPLPSLGDDVGRTHSHPYHVLDLTKATYSPLVCHGCPSQPRGERGAQPLQPSRLQLEKDAGTSGWADQFGFGCYLATSRNSCPSPPGWIPLLRRLQRILVSWGNFRTISHDPNAKPLLKCLH